MTNISAVSSLGGQSEAERNSDGIGLAEDFDDFLKILLTQLQVQDPTEPMDTEAFTDQLVQFAEVEQSINQNKTLSNIEQQLIKNAAIETVSTTAVNYVGKTVTVHNSIANKTDGGAQWKYATHDDAEIVSVGVFDKNGEVVLFQTDEIEGGQNFFVWDGNDSFGQPVPNGEYYMEVQAFNEFGQEVFASTDVEGMVHAVDFVNGETYLNIVGGHIAKITDVKSVTEELPSTTE